MIPYLILDESMIDIIILTKKRGVDVKIFTPYIPDKKFVFYVTRRNYKELIKNGIEIYEYKPGFVHSKVMLSDDKNAILGCANFDMRSMYLHYENGVYIHNDDCLYDIKNDFLNLKKDCLLIDNYKAIPLYQRILGSILKIFASQF